MLKMKNILDLSIKDIHEALIKKQTTPLKLVKEAIKRAKKDKNNAFEYIMEHEAIEMAKKLIEPDINNFLWGIPFTIKDNISTKDIQTCASSKILIGYKPIFNATVVEKLINKNAIPIAKTTLDELAMGGTGTTGHLGKTFNPYDPTHTHMIGGSSCGSAATVAAKIVPFSLGSDTGDSIRKPASYAGLVGFKPTWSRISRFGLFPFVPSLDTIGFFTRNVEDAAILLNATAGYDEKDFTSSTIKFNLININDFNKSIKNIKIAIIKEINSSIKSKKIIEKFNETIIFLKSLGAKINYVSIDKKILRTFFLTYFIISCAEATSNNANLDGFKFGNNLVNELDNYNDSILKNRNKNFSLNIKKRFIFGSYALIKNNQKCLYLKAKKNRHKIVNIINKIFETNDFIYLPATSTIAPKFNNKIDKTTDQYLIAENHLLIGNFAGLPSITIPIDYENNLPFGFNLTGKKFNEKELLNIAKIIENKVKFYNRYDR